MPYRYKMPSLQSNRNVNSFKDVTDNRETLVNNEVESDMNGPTDALLMLT